MLSNRYETFEVGDIAVFQTPDRDIPIVHRILEIIQDNNGKQYFLTKGDNNEHFDMSLYRNGKRWLPRESMLGKIVAMVPHLGMFTLFLTEHVVIKCLLITVVIYTAFIDV